MAGIEQADVDELVDFCRTLFEYLYVMPARLAARKNRETHAPIGSRGPIAEIQKVTDERAAIQVQKEEKAAKDRQEAVVRLKNTPKPFS